jgi:pimeloyl-ACP methyl ester carboxylesterase
MGSGRQDEGQRHGGSGGGDSRERMLEGLPVTQRRLELSGVSTAVLEGGDGPPVVLLHSSAEFAALWMRVIPGLVERHRVVAPDLPGHGASRAGEGPLGVERVLTWLAELIGRTCSAPPTLVGRGLGGAIAARFAIANGDRLARLVLVDSFGLAPFEPAPSFGLALNRFMERPDERTRDGLFEQCFADLPGLRRQLPDRWEPLASYALDQARTPAAQAALGSLMPAFGLPAIPAAELASIAVPTTLVWGRQDLQVLPRVGEAASARHGWPLQVIDHAGDDPPMEQPAAFLKALRAVLDVSAGARAVS